MTRWAHLRTPLLVIAVTAAILGGAGFALSQMPPLPAHPGDALSPTALLTKPIDNAASDAAQLLRG